jgi:hypothetical protein
LPIFLHAAPPLALDAFDGVRLSWTGALSSRRF